MSNLPQISNDIIEKVLITGDLSKLSPEHRVNYYQHVCTSLGLNPLTKPFEYITLNGKLTLYAKKDCTDQLRNLYSISVQISDRSKMDDVYLVTAKATNASGRCDESIGAVNIANLRGDALANALMKAETKAKRRATLSLCGLGILDETETETIPQATIVRDEPLELQASPPVPSDDPEDFIVDIGKKFLGKKLKDIDSDELLKFVEWIEKDAKPDFRASEKTKRFLHYTKLFFAKKYRSPMLESFEHADFDQPLVIED